MRRSLYKILCRSICGLFSRLLPCLSFYADVSGDVTATPHGMMTSLTVGGSGSSLLHAWCTATNQQHLLPHLLHQHIADRFQHFRSCYTLPPEMTSPPWVHASTPETRARRQAAEEFSSDAEDDDEDVTDTETGQVRTTRQSSELDPARVVGCRKKKTRTVFSRAQVCSHMPRCVLTCPGVFSRGQVLQLESTFDAKRYLSSAERSSLAAALRLTETQVTYTSTFHKDHLTMDVQGRLYRLTTDVQGPPY